MIKKELREAEIREGKVWLEGRIIPNAELLRSDQIVVSSSFSFTNRFNDRVEMQKPLNADAYVKTKPLASIKEGIDYFLGLTPQLCCGWVLDYYVVLYLNCHLNEENGK